MQYDTIMYVSDICTVKVRKQGRSKENSHRIQGCVATKVVIICYLVNIKMQ